MQNYFSTFYFGELKPYNSKWELTVVISSYFGLQLIFAPQSFAVLFGSRNKGHANIKGFTVSLWNTASLLPVPIEST